MQQRFGVRISFLLVVLAAGACKASSCAHSSASDTTAAASSSANADASLDTIFFEPSGEDGVRVTRAFPKGVATDDAGAEIGRATAPPEDDAPDGTSEFVAELAIVKPLSVAQIRSAIPATDGGRIERSVKGRTKDAERWAVLDDVPADTQFQRVAIVVSLVDDGKPIDAARLDRESRWAAALSATLKLAAPKFSMTPAAAIAKAQSALAAREQYSDEDVDVGVVIAAPSGTTFRGRLVWDAVYSAGFRWGDGDYFHWIPSPSTDVSQGIGMGSTSGSSYFLPESIIANDGSADVEGLEMSFNAARCLEPKQVFDVMARAANYFARRLGGKLVTRQGALFDASAERGGVMALERGLLAHGVVPGSNLALSIF